MSEGPPVVSVANGAERALSQQEGANDPFGESMASPASASGSMPPPPGSTKYNSAFQLAFSSDATAPAGNWTRNTPAAVGEGGQTRGAEEDDDSKLASFLQKDQNQRRVSRELRKSASLVQDKVKTEFEASFEAAAARRRSTVHSFNLRKSSSGVDDEGSSRDKNDVVEYLRSNRASLARTLAQQEWAAQQISAKDIFCFLSEEQVVNLRKQFDAWERQEGGSLLDVNRFTELLLDILKQGGHVTDGSSQERRLRKEITQLFHAIDYDASGTVDWDELTNYLMYVDKNLKPEEVMVLHQSASMPITKHAPTKASVKYAAERDVIYVLEKDDEFASVSLLNPKTRNVFAKVTVDPAASCAEYVPELDRFFVMSHRWAATSYSISEHKTLGVRVAEEQRLAVPKPALLMQYCRELKLMFTGTGNGEVMAYPLATLTKSWQPCMGVRCHAEPVSCLIPVPRMNRVISSSLFGGLNVIDVRRGVVITEVGMKEDRESGIHAMLFTPELNVVVTAGHNPTLQLWMATGVSDPKIGQLADPGDPHRHSIVGLWHDTQRLPNTVVSADASGLVKMWDLRSMRCVDSKILYPVCDDGVTWHASGLCSEDASRRLFVLGTSVTTHTSTVEQIDIVFKHVLEAEEEAKRLNTLHLRMSVFNPTNNQVVSVVNNDIFVYDLATGKVTSVFEKVNHSATSQLTVIDIDPLGRRLYVGTNDGRVFVVNGATGEVTFEYTKMRSAVVFVVATVAKTLVVGCAGGQVCSFSLEVDKATPLHTLSLPLPCNVRLTVCAYSPITESLLIGASDERIFSCDAKGPKVTSAGDSRRTIDEEDQSVAKLFAPTDNAGNTNFETDRQIFDYMTAKVGECTCATVLRPFSCVAVADTSASIALWSAKPCTPLGLMCCRWENYTPRAILPGTAVSVVTAAAFRMAENGACTLFTADDQGCVVQWDVGEVLKACGLADHESTMNERMPTLCSVTSTTTVVPIVQHCFVVRQYVPLCSLTIIDSCEILMVGCSTGETLLLTFSGGLVGTMIPDRAYKDTAPPNYFLSIQTAAEFTEARRRRKEVTKTKVLWGRVRGNVASPSAALASTVTEVVKESRLNQPIDAFDGDQPELADTRVIFAPETACPCSTPSGAKVASPRFQIQPYDSLHVCSTIDRASIKAMKLTSATYHADESLEAHSDDEADDGRRRNSTRETLLVVQQAAARLAECRLTVIEELLEHDAKVRSYGHRRGKTPLEFHDDTLVEIPRSAPNLFSGSIAAALSTPMACLLIAPELPFAPEWIRHLQRRFTPHDISAIVDRFHPWIDLSVRKPGEPFHYFDEANDLQAELQVSGDWWISGTQRNLPNKCGRRIRSAPPVIEHSAPHLEARRIAVDFVEAQKPPTLIGPCLPQLGDALNACEEETHAIASLPETQSIPSDVEGQLGGVNQSVPSPPGRPLSRTSISSVSFSDLLQASTPLYPLQPSPFLSVGRVPPALLPAHFGESMALSTARPSSLQLPTPGQQETHHSGLHAYKERPLTPANVVFRRGMKVMHQSRISLLHPHYIAGAAGGGLKRTVAAEPRQLPPPAFHRSAGNADAAKRDIRAPSSRPRSALAALLSGSAAAGVSAPLFATTRPLPQSDEVISPVPDSCWKRHTSSKSEPPGLPVGATAVSGPTALQLPIPSVSALREQHGTVADDGTCALGENANQRIVGHNVLAEEKMFHDFKASVVALPSVMEETSFRSGSALLLHRPVSSVARERSKKPPAAPKASLAHGPPTDEPLQVGHQQQQCTEVTIAVASGSQRRVKGWAHDAFAAKFGAFPPPHVAPAGKQPRFLGGRTMTLKAIEEHLRKGPTMHSDMQKLCQRKEDWLGAVQGLEVDGRWKPPS